MAPSRILPAVLGITALLGTAAMIVLDVANAQANRASSHTVQIAAVVASACEAIMFIVLAVLLCKCLRPSAFYRSRKPNDIWFGMSLFGCVIATTASVVVLVLLGKGTNKFDILGAPYMNFFIGSAIAHGFTFAGQLLFLVVYFVLSRVPDFGPAYSLHAEDGGRRAPETRVKSIPYTQTSISSEKPQASRSTDLLNQTRPGSSSVQSLAESIISIRTYISQAVRPISSKTRLLSVSSRTGRRPASLESTANRYRSGSNDEGFDSWDTSAVESHHRQSVLETIPSPPRFLETIPASPTTSRSPSPGFPLDLEPPRTRRSRSCSPIPRSRPSLTTHESTSELHIHPLFRSDSQTPPPAATPETVVLAAPGAGKVISHKNIPRMRSGSLPAASSPLSRQGSYDSFRRKAESPTSDRVSPTHIESIEEGTMTPPIPEWILSAGSRSSLSDYEGRKLRDQGEKGDEGSGITQRFK